MTNFRSPIFALSDEYIEKAAAFSPMEATALGIPGYDDRLDDFSLAEFERQAAYSRGVLAQLKNIEPIDEIDRVAKEVMIERMESYLALHDTNEKYITYNPIASPASSVRQIFTLMPYETPQQIANITSRLNAVGTSMQSWKSALEELHTNGLHTARRQVLVVAEQLRAYADGNYQKFAKDVDPNDVYPSLHEAARRAEVASLEMSIWMLDIHAPRSVEADGVGAQRYAPWAKFFTGAELDLRATYEWGLKDLAQINERMWGAAEKILPGAKSLVEVADFLEASDHLRIEGSEALLKELKDFTEAAITKLDGVFFDVDDRIRFCDARLAPEGAAAAPYYMPPSEDLSRPGTTWYPTLGETRFNFWHIASTWYHEAVPGHHLQCATAILEKDRLSRFQRTFAWISGYGEGWALYAERFMDELGAFEDPAMEMGFLSAQALRAARVVVDIGMHCGYPDSEGKVWNADSAYELLVNSALQSPAMAKSEIERYLGWPGQAISYKVGERFILEIREAAKKRLGVNFSIRNFHSYILKIGPMGLDPLTKEMSVWQGEATK